MEKDEKQGQSPRPSRRSLRLTFRLSDGKFELVSSERLEMIAPPPAGEWPKAGKHSGFWVELQDSESQALAYNLINSTLLNSVEVHSPEGKIERAFGEVKEGIFEVLLPDKDDAKSVVLLGDSLIQTQEKGQLSEGSYELARFELPERGKGG